MRPFFSIGLLVFFASGVHAQNLKSPAPAEASPSSAIEKNTAVGPAGSAHSQNASASPSPARAADPKGKKCFYVNSYHRGYEWSDEIEQALNKTLQGQCSLQVFYMDTRNQNSPEYAARKGAEAKAWIESEKPDVVIVSDDAAAEKVWKDHFQNQRIPFVFCGLNLPPKFYGLPGKNITGMIEVDPVAKLIRNIKEIAPQAKTAVYLSGPSLMDRTTYELQSPVYERNGIVLKPAYATTMQSWEKIYKAVQNADVIVLANYTGIEGWTFDGAKAIVSTYTRKLTVTHNDFMKSLATLSLTKSAREQGEWAGQLAVEILRGVTPGDIPIAVNRQSHLYLNPDVLKVSGLHVPETISRKASKISL